jgi:hypothetical protein
MADWVSLKQQLTEARKDMKVLNTREKQLKDYIANYMKNVKIDSVNLKKGKVTMRVSERSGTMTKAAVQNGLFIYFQEDETRVEAAMNCILDNIDKKQTTVVSLTGVKKSED